MENIAVLTIRTTKKFLRLYREIKNFCDYIPKIEKKIHKITSIKRTENRRNQIRARCSLLPDPADRNRDREAGDAQCGR
jgi:dsDNA-specific endonuclease/ATPase MutS2